MNEDKLNIFEKIVYGLVIASMFVWAFSPEAIKEIIKIISFLLLTTGFIISGFLKREEKLFIIILSLAWIVMVAGIF
ncbi:MULTISPECIES: hypothetical protein [Bacillus]|uniref:hypothetical protein n=1 Tax=Bacillus TaxID=1386 RepID=UPI002244234F|nr:MULTISPECIES: hypothetical protein [Bacillus]MDN5387424.1 hypothetical protein [Bacillus sp. LB7]MEC1020332.1 hypothetical protein [Bacillus paralicheniformis]MEC1027230.1 hypothetical protein [Bacillus paralicheniformis]MEC1036269.1 hypothetical protein [Bacillus paralicheniformis]MEC1051289.1 hypothetical protein [Bacillus paralicheniformis]